MCMCIRFTDDMALLAEDEKKHFLRDLGKRTMEETKEVLCIECSVVWCRDLDSTTE